MTSLAERIKQRRQQSGITPTTQKNVAKKQTSSLPLNERIQNILETLKLATYDQIAFAEELQSILSEGVSRSDLAKKINKPQGWISKRLALLDAPEDMQNKIRTGELAINPYYESTTERIKKITIPRKQAIELARTLRDIGIKYGINIELSQKPTNKEIINAFNRAKAVKGAVLD